jgi:predicted cytidylate kinase
MISTDLLREEVYMRKNKIRVTISGSVGSGKSTIGNLLSKELNTEFISVGNLSRKRALLMGMDIDQFQLYLKKHPQLDKEMDIFIANEMNSKTNFILDYRLGYHFIENSFNILLKVSPEIALNRISDRQNSDEKYFQLTDEERILKMANRNKSMRDRFFELYNTDFLNEGNYQLVIQTDLLKPTDIVKQIIENMI